MKILSLVIKFTSIRILLYVVIHFVFLLEQMNIKIAFLQGDLYEKIYTKQYEGFIKRGIENLVCLLKKSLYGIK